MIVKVRKIGNSVGVLLSKAIVEQCAITDQVKLEVKGNSIIIHPVKSNPREGWAERFLAAGSLEDNEILMPEQNDHSFDNEEWTW